MTTFDYGSEQGTGRWIGVAGYAHYAATDKIGLTLRSEIFDDQAGARMSYDQTF